MQKLHLHHKTGFIVMDETWFRKNHLFSLFTVKHFVEEHEL